MAEEVCHCHCHCWTRLDNRFGGEWQVRVSSYMQSAPSLTTASPLQTAAPCSVLTNLFCKFKSRRRELVEIALRVISGWIKLRLGQK